MKNEIRNRIGDNEDGRYLEFVRHDPIIAHCVRTRCGKVERNLSIKTDENSRDELARKFRIPR